VRRYIHKHKKWAVGERCQCGHGRAGHDDLEVLLNGQAKVQQGLGNCRVAGCTCPKFRRSGWVFEGEPEGDG
jgi:hypothetical protein